MKTQIYLTSDSQMGRIFESQLPKDRNFIWIGGGEIPECGKTIINDLDSEKNNHKYICLKLENENLTWLNSENKGSFFTGNSYIFGLNQNVYNSNKSLMETRFYPGYHLILKVIVTYTLPPGDVAQVVPEVSASFYFEKGAPKQDLSTITEIAGLLKSMEQRHAKKKVGALKRKLTDAFLKELNLDIFEIGPNGPDIEPDHGNGGGSGTGGIASGVRVPGGQ